MRDRTNLVAHAGLVALAIAMGIGRFAFTPILPMMQGDAGITVVQGGWLASANYVGYLLGGLGAAALRISATRAIRIGLATVVLSTLAMGLTSELRAWLLLRAVAGVASAWVLVFTSAWCLETFQQAMPIERRATLSATVFAGVGVGIAVAGALCALLLTAGTSSSVAWLVLGTVALVAALAICIPVRGASAALASGEPAPRWSARHWGMILCYGAFGFGYIVPATFVSTMARSAAPDPATYGWSWPAFGAAAAASTFVAAKLRKRFEDRSIWIASHFVMAAGVVVPLLVAGLRGIVVSALLVGGTFMVVTMVGIQEARRVAGAHARPLIAAMTSAFALGQIAGPLAVSAFAARGHDFAPALLTAGALLILSALALIRFPNPKGSP